MKENEILKITKILDEWNPLGKEIINTINIQVNKYGGGCVVNLGLHLTLLSLCWADKLPDIKNIKEIDYEFRMRLAPKNGLLVEV